MNVELYGIVRHRAGRAELVVEANTVLDAIRSVERQFPAVGLLARPDGSLNPQYLVSIDGERFVTDLNERVPAGARVLILGADAGG